MKPVATALLALLAGCASAPTVEEVDRANIGTMPSQERCEEVARLHFAVSLKDPDSAKLRFGTVRKGWYRASMFQGVRYAWELCVSVNARNSYGGYVGSRPWFFYFLDNDMVAIGSMERIRTGSNYSDELVVVECPGGRTAEQAGL